MTFQCSLWPGWEGRGNARALPGLKMLSAAELKDLFMPFECCFRPHDMGTGRYRFSPKHASCLPGYQAWWLWPFQSWKELLHRLNTLAVWNHQSTIRPFWYFPVPDVTMPFQIHFQFICPFPFRFYPTLVIPHNIIICWFSKASTIFALRNSYLDFPT